MNSLNTTIISLIAVALAGPMANTANTVNNIANKFGLDKQTARTMVKEVLSAKHIAELDMEA